ncbi:MAG: hypothetical protein NT004_06300 [Bacteroidetes bacterium]|nr:hypothetical protein [Bacteroidota bacterium]
MTKTERQELKKQGVTVLRPQINGKLNCWMIVGYTDGGGWSPVGPVRFSTQAAAQDIVNWMVKLNPTLFAKED